MHSSSTDDCPETSDRRSSDTMAQYCSTVAAAMSARTAAAAAATSDGSDDDTTHNVMVDSSRRPQFRFRSYSATTVCKSSSILIIEEYTTSVRPSRQQRSSKASSFARPQTSLQRQDRQVTARRLDDEDAAIRKTRRDFNQCCLLSDTCCPSFCVSASVRPPADSRDI